MIYWLPPKGIEWSKAETVLSVFDQPFVTMTEVEHVTLLGLALQEGRGDGIHIRGGADCLIARCTIRQFGGDAIVIEGGQRHGIFGCTMNTLGCGGARVAGGDRQTLTPAFISSRTALCLTFPDSKEPTHQPSISMAAATGLLTTCLRGCLPRRCASKATTI
jgi:hypothetical protein